MHGAAKVALGLTAFIVVGVLGSALTDRQPQRAETATVTSPAGEGLLGAPALEPAAPSLDPARPEQGAELLLAASGGDGDSWRDTSGQEYRLGLVNTPESNECFGSEATAMRKEMTTAGFRADSYSADTYGRSVTVVTLADGTNLNLWLARQGYANDRYLEQFRHENPVLAAELDEAFTAAKAERLGLWDACSQPAPPAQAPPPTAAAPPAGTGACHPDYLTCVPVKGDGSGNGSADDLDCGQIGTPVEARAAGVDPYRLDGDGDGVGCE